MIVRFQLFQRLSGVYVVQLGAVHLQQDQISLVTPDDGVTAAVLPQLQQLREKPGGEEAGIAPDAVVAQGRDLVGLLLPKLHKFRHGFLSQQRLVGYQEQDPVAVPQRRQPQLDGVTDAEVGMLVADSCKGKLLCKHCDFRILRHNGYRVKYILRHCFQCPPDEAFSPEPDRQLVFSKPPGIARGHHNTSKFHQNTPVFSLIPVYPLSPT